MGSTMSNTFGMLFDAVVVGAALYGAGCLQGYLYFRKYAENDPWFLRVLVGVILVCDTFQVGILTACVYEYVILNFGNQDILGSLLNTLIIEIFFSDVIAVAVQMFYCWRIWRLSNGNFFMVLPLALLSLAAFGSLLVYSCLALNFETFEELTSLKNLSMSCNILAAASDILISTAMVFLLQSAKTAYKKTNNMINRLILFAFNTGLPVSFCALWACISINVWPSTFVYMFFFLLQGRLYTNSLLVSLNSREYIKRGSCKGYNTETGFPMNSYGSPLEYHVGVGDANSPEARPSKGSSLQRESQEARGSAITIRIDTTRHTDAQFSGMDKTV
ncbi:hypothetical protein GYMLUDRAFT_255444 [Collybiopsis luxurians FD-317 M1]|nr:hypothetical protein GYMLUDRAFT_255444 [Collybiopsis luxurians FD-317 M1]